MKRSASEEIKKGDSKVPKLESHLVDFFDTLPDELFDKVLTETLAVGNGALANLALTCIDHLEYIQKWSLGWVHGHPLLMSDTDSNELCALSLPYAEYVMKENFEDKEKAVVLSDVFAGLSTSKTFRKIYQFINGIEISNTIRELTLKRLVWLSLSSVPFTDGIKLSETVQDMIDAGLYRFLFPYLYLEKNSSETSLIFNTAVDIFICDHHNEEAECPSQAMFLKSLIVNFPELWAAKFQQLCDSLTIFTFDGQDLSEKHPVYKAIRSMTDGTQLLHLNDDTEFSKRIVPECPICESYFYSLILSGLMSGVFYEIEVYYQRMASINSTCDLLLQRLFDAIQVTLRNLKADDLRQWDWILKDLVQQYFFMQKPEIINRLLFSIYMKQEDAETIQFIYGCIVPGTEYFEKFLEHFLKDMSEKNVCIAEKLSVNHLVHILKVLPQFDGENCQKYLKQLIMVATEKLLSTNEKELIQYFSWLLENNPVFKKLFVGAVKESKYLRQNQKIWALIKKLPHLEDELKQTIID